jgi:sulfur dioxygenase
LIQLLLHSLISLVAKSQKNALLIDPVLEQIDRDTTLIKSLGLKLTHAINTHCHADHVTSTGTLKSSFDFKTLISKKSGAKADILLNGNKEFIHWGTNQKLQVLSTPGHTSGCISLYEATLGVFTGDALMINGCGRTDFQDGDSEQLYDSVHEQLYTSIEYSCIPGTRLQQQNVLHYWNRKRKQFEIKSI